MDGDSYEFHGRRSSGGIASQSSLKWMATPTHAKFKVANFDRVAVLTKMDGDSYPQRFLPSNSMKTKRIFFVAVLTKMDGDSY
jgi:hypothetical protein